MLITKINAFQNFASNKVNKTENRQTNNMSALNKANATDSFTFGSKQKLLPQELIPTANAVVEKFLKLDAPTQKATDILLKKSSTPEEKAIAKKIRTEGTKFEIPVTIAGKQQNCRASIGYYMNGRALNLDIGQNAPEKRYRISLNKDNKVTEASKLQMQKFEKNQLPGGFISLERNVDSNLKTVLETLAKN